MAEKNHPKKVIVVGGGLSGLSAARELLVACPNIDLTVLEAMDRVGGRTNTVNINGFIFDEGAEYIGPSQKYALELAKQSGNKLVDVSYAGSKIASLQGKSVRYDSQYPSSLGFWGTIEMRFVVWKLNRMASKVPTLSPKDCEMGYQWDAVSAQTWLDQNVRNSQAKVIIQMAFKAVLANELTEVSLLYMLWFLHQNKSFQNLVDIKDGLQQKVTKLGTQHMSKYLAEVIKSNNGKVLCNVFVRKIEQKENVCRITDSNGKVYECDYLIMACSPWQANKVSYFPQLSSDRRLLCERGIMGSYTKVFLLYKRAYWRQKGLSGQLLSDCLEAPILWASDDTKINERGEQQPVIVVFVGGQALRFWKDRDDFQQILARKLAKIFDEPEMMQPIKVHWKNWDDQPSIGGGPTGMFGPGVLSQVEDLRKPEGAIHWAGTELATVSTGYMDGAIESGIRAGREVAARVKGCEERRAEKKETAGKGLWYTRYVRTARKWVEWL